MLLHSIQIFRFDYEFGIGIGNIVTQKERIIIISGGKRDEKEREKETD